MISIKNKRFAKIGAGLLAVSLMSGCAILGGDDDKKATPTLGDRTSILGAESGAAVDPALAGISVIIPAPRTNADWAQPAGNASKPIDHLALGPASSSGRP